MAMDLSFGFVFGETIHLLVRLLRNFLPLPSGVPLFSHSHLFATAPTTDSTKLSRSAAALPGAGARAQLSLRSINQLGGAPHWASNSLTLQVAARHGLELRRATAEQLGSTTSPLLGSSAAKSHACSLPFGKLGLVALKGGAIAARMGGWATQSAWLELVCRPPWALLQADGARTPGPGREGCERRPPPASPRLRTSPKSGSCAAAALLWLRFCLCVRARASHWTV